MRIYLRNIGRHALIDSADAWAAEHPWYGYQGTKDKRYYVRASIYKGVGDYLAAHLHRLIADAAPGEYVRFRNRNALDCRRENLIKSKPRIANHRRAKESDNEYRGVVRRGQNSYTAEIQVDNKVYRLGTFKTPERAAFAYDDKARELLGSLAYCNFPRTIKEALE